MSSIRPGVEHDEWKSRTLSMLADLRAAGDWSVAEEEVAVRYLNQWFGEAETPVIEA